MHGSDVAQQSRCNSLAHETEMRGPAPVLIDCQLKPATIGQIGQALANVEIHDKRFLTEYVLAGL